MLVIQKVYDGDRRHADYKDLGEVATAVTAKYGTGGGNTPIVLQGYEGVMEIVMATGQANAEIMRGGVQH